MKCKLNFKEINNNKNYTFVYNYDRVKFFNCFNIYYNFSNLKINYKLYNFNKLFFSFFNCSYRYTSLFYLFNNNIVRFINSYFININKFLNNNIINSVKIIESFNFFCKFSYSKLYNKLIIKFNKYDIKLILFKHYCNNYSNIFLNNFLSINNKNDKIFISNDYFNFFISNIKNIRKSNDYTGKGIRYLNEIFSLKFRKKIK
uniref:Ribosomal protein L6 n=1 Tax=Babesia rodhaini TaxID=5870 RepID=A0A455R046_BABRO|nr:ribosomal protein L6 [Babesia rodhaini]